jgi:hypothetical protein
MFAGTKFENKTVYITSGPKRYWKFTGELYSEFEEFVELVIEAGESLWMPHYGIYASRQRLMTHPLCELLAAFIQIEDYTGAEWLRYAQDFPNFSDRITRGFDTNYGDLLYLGMAESAPSSHVRRGRKWRATEAGRKFIQEGGECPSHVVVNNKQVTSVSEKKLTLLDFYDEADIEKFNLTHYWWVNERPVLCP